MKFRCQLYPEGGAAPLDAAARCLLGLLDLDVGIDVRRETVWLDDDAEVSVHVLVSTMSIKYFHFDAKYFYNNTCRTAPDLHEAAPVCRR